MKIKAVAAIITCFIITNVYSQTNLNNYKYVVVPNKFDFLKEENKYRLNELAQFLFSKHGFQAVMEGTDYPEDLLFNGCLGLRSDVFKEPGMFKTKLKIVLKDCNGRTVYTSPTGESREKEFKVAYTEAMRDAFNYLVAINYQYKPKKEQKAVAPKVKKQESEVASEIEKLKEEIKNLKKEKEVAATKQPQSIVKETPHAPEKPEMVETKNPAPKVEKLPSNVLYAQAIENGYQLVDSSPKVVYRIQQTGLADVFLVEGKSSIIYKKNDTWVLELYENNELKRQE